jgi:hypothetical protein
MVRIRLLPGKSRTNIDGDCRRGFLSMRKRLRSPRGFATVHTPEGMPLPPKILVCAAIVKIRDEHRLRGSCATELLEFYRAYYPPSVMSSGAVTFGTNW